MCYKFITAIDHIIVSISTFKKLIISIIKDMC